MYNEEFKDKIKEDLKKSLSSHRYTHVLGVAAAARELADRYGCDADTAEVAGLLHDAAKQLPLPEMQALLGQWLHVDRALSDDAKYLASGTLKPDAARGL